MRVADYVANFVADAGVDRVFMIAGGLSMHLVDAFATNPRLKYMCLHHEQAAVMAAEGYARERKGIGVACVTAGPGATNTLTGVVSAYFDSTPMLIITGQAKAADVKYEGVRQFAVQGFDTLSIFKHTTKYAVLVDDKSRVRYELEKALYMAKEGRPGPSWIEIPLEVQGAHIEPDKLEGFVPQSPKDAWQKELGAKMPKFVEMLKVSKRPLLLLGNGVGLSGAAEDAKQIAEMLNIPMITSRLGLDLVATHHPLFVGRPGLYGDRPSHFAIQNCDLLISIGCRRCQALTAYNCKEFAENAKKVVIDIDQGELGKRGLGNDLGILCDAKEFLVRLKGEAAALARHDEKWAEKCRYWKMKYPTVLPEYSDDSEGINSYYLVKRLSAALGGSDTVVLDTSSPFHVVPQSLEIKEGQTFITTGGLSEMGYGLPAAIGVAAVKKNGKTVCIVGDGSLQMNLQEMQTIVHYKLPVKMIIINNGGYLLIRHTQRNFQEGRLIGESPETGMSCPDLEKIAKAYGIKYRRVSKVSELDDALKNELEGDGPEICEVMSPKWQLIVPRVASEKMPDGKMVSHPYADMFPYLERKEYEKEINYWKNEG